MVSIVATKAKLEANARYLQKLDDIKVRVKKGDRAKIQAHAKKRGFDSLNAYITHLIEEDMKKEP